jgi:hypothetical protein
MIDRIIQSKNQNFTGIRTSVILFLEKAFDIVPELSRTKMIIGEFCEVVFFAQRILRQAYRRQCRLTTHDAKTILAPDTQALLDRHK